MADDKKTVEIPAWAAGSALWLFRALVAFTCAAAWSTYLDVRDLVQLRDDPNGVLQGSFSRNDWEYEKKLLLIEHENMRNELATLLMQLDELEDELR